MVETPAAAQWRNLVGARQAEAEAVGAGQRGYWSRRAATFKRSMAGREDPFLEFIEPWLTPHKTLIDAGAGFGRHAVPLAARVDWVTAVEPSEGMRELLETAPNMTVIASSWEDAEAAPADLVICCHVLYGVAEPVPFIRKLESCARERVFITMRDRQPAIPAEEAWSVLSGSRTRMPEFGDLLALLEEIDVQPEVARLTYASARSYGDFEEAVDEVRSALGEHWDEARGRTWLQQRLRRQADGALVYDAGDMTTGVAHWTPRSI
jgi:hypothetical protein